MRKRIKRKQLSRTKSHLKALRRNMVTSLILFEKMKTTKAKARFAVNDFNKVISIIKSKDVLRSQRELKKIVFDQNAVSKVENVFKVRFNKINTGFINKYKLPNRRGDNAEMVLLLVRGYEYKGLGEKVEKGKKSKDRKEEKKSSGDTPSKIQKDTDTMTKSQVDVKSKTQGKAKSRSGI